MKNITTKLIVVAAYIIVLSGCNIFRHTSSNSKPKIECNELAYGIYESDSGTNEELKSAPNGFLHQSSEFKLVKQTDKILGKLAQEFGVSYILKSKDIEDVKIECVWIFPKSIENAEGKIFKETRYTSEKITNDTTFATYVLDKEFEIVKGKWIFQLYYNKKKLMERTFYVE